MHRVFLFSILLLIIFSCRKDDSTFTDSGSKQKCLIEEIRDVAGDLVSKKVYNEDNVVIEEYNYDEGKIDESHYLEKEKEGQYLYYYESKEEEPISRIYLNTDGTLNREVGIVIANDGSYEDDLNNVDSYIYNSKKQLIRLEGNGPQANGGKIEIEYDSKDRVKYISAKDKNGKEVSHYNNFTYVENRVKNDNYVNLYFAESLSRYFLPSINNVYIKSYDIIVPEAGMNNEDLVTKFKFDFDFSGGKLSHITTSGEFFGIPFVLLEKITLSCK